jgi:acyl-coenzyme A thioesterase PaaI-like protein
MITLEQLNRRGIGFLPGYLGIVVTSFGRGEMCAELHITPQLIAPNGFTTIELKTNFLGTARSGVIACVAKAAHLGRTTQVWDATVTYRDTGKTIALFRCTQMLLYAKQDRRSPQPV